MHVTGGSSRNDAARCIRMAKPWKADRAPSVGDERPADYRNYRWTRRERASALATVPLVRTVLVPSWVDEGSYVKGEALRVGVGSGEKRR